MTRQRGISLPEVIIFIVIMGIALAGMFALFSQLTKQSPDPLARKQALAVAQSLMEEIQLRPFTFCDPDDPAVYTAAAATYTTDCATVENLGIEGAEGRYASAALRFDNVSDYSGFAMATGAIKDIAEATISGLEQFSASVSITDVTTIPNDFTSVPVAIPNNSGDALLIAVTVNGPLGVTVTLHGYRLRYAPNSP